MADLPRPVTTIPAAAKADGLTDDDSRTLRIIQFMARDNPDKWREAPEKFLAFVKKNYEYQEKWAKDNASQVFDPNAPEHDQWYAENDHGIPQEALDEAMIDMRAEERIARRTKPDPELEELKAEKALQRAWPVMNANLDRLVLKFVEQVDPELAKLVTDANGQPRFTPENVALIEGQDAVAKEIMDAIVRQQIEPLVIELEKLTSPEFQKLGYALDPERVPLHAALDRYRQQFESELLNGPPEARDFADGRKFLPLSVIKSRRAAIDRSNASEADKASQRQTLDGEYRSLTTSELQELIVAEWAERAREQIAVVDGLARKKYPANGAPRPAPAPTGEQPPTPPTPAVRPAPTQAPTNRPAPSFSSGSDVVTSPEKIGAGQKTFGEQAVEVHFK